MDTLRSVRGGAALLVVTVSAYWTGRRLADAAEIIAVHPQALQLRFLQTLTEVATENNSTILFPIPIDLLTPFLRGNQPAVGSGGNGEKPG